MRTTNELRKIADKIADALADANTYAEQNFE